MRIFQVDTFTATRFTGNPAIVVLDADGQSDATLLAVARRVLARRGGVRVRGECSGPRCAAALLQFPQGDALRRPRHHRRPCGAAGSGQARRGGLPAAFRRRHHRGVGAQVEQAAAGAQTLIEFRQTAPELETPLPFKTTLRVAEALRLPATQLHEIMPARIARKGSSRLLVPIADPRHLDALAPNFDTLLSLGNELGTEGFFVFALNRSPDELSTESRMFCPALGIAGGSGQRQRPRDAGGLSVGSRSVRQEFAPPSSAAKAGR